MQKITKRKSNSKSKKVLRRKTKTRKSQKGGFGSRKETRKATVAISPKDELLQLLETAKNTLATLETRKNEILENKRKFFNSGRKADYGYNSPNLNTPEETKQWINSQKKLLNDNKAKESIFDKELENIEKQIESTNNYIQAITKNLKN